MCGHAVALVCTLFLSESAVVTRSSLPSPRARVCAFRCVRVRFNVGIEDVSPVSSARRSSCSPWSVVSFPSPAHLLVFSSSSVPLFPPPPYVRSYTNLNRPRFAFFLLHTLWVFFYVPLGTTTIVLPCFHFCPRVRSHS